MNEQKITWVQEDVVVCEGNGLTSGHPRVYYTLAPNGQAKCGYCGKVFQKKPQIISQLTSQTAKESKL